MVPVEDRGLRISFPLPSEFTSASDASARVVPEALQDLPRLMEEMAKVAAAIGSAAFYPVALAVLGSFLGCHRQLAMRYAQFAKPQFLVNRSLAAEAVALYMRKLYRIDPLLKLVRSQVRERVLTTADLRLEENGTVYFEDLYHSAQIYDELVVLLPAAGGVWVALCVDVNDRHFSPEEVAFVRHLYPLLDSLHQRHIYSCLSGRRGAYLNDSQLAVMVLDSEGHVCFRNGVWGEKVSFPEEEVILAVAASAEAGVHSLNERDVVHWEQLEGGNALAPGGRIFMVEGRSPGYLGIDTLFSQLAADYDLTPRECEIISLGLRGYSTAAIAKSLDIGAGTVRNHKHRLYAKLDVTSEREIASLILGKIFSKVGS